MDYATDSTGATSAQVNQADMERTKRAFVGFLSSALGVDQTYANDDMYVGNQPGQYIIANPDGTYSSTGRSTSNLQRSVVPGVTLSPLLIVAALVAFVIFRKG